MFSITTYEDTFEMFRLGNDSHNSFMDICPQRGGIVTRLCLDGHDLLYLERDKFLDKQSRVRGGIPILFPVCGPLIDGQYEWFNGVYELKTHGFAQDRPWRIEELGINQRCSYITIALESDADLLRVYPFDFSLFFTFIMSEHQLTIKQQYTNTGTTDMPFYAGFHPYLKTCNRMIHLECDATHFLDYNDASIHDFHGFLDMKHRQQAVALYDAKTPEVTLFIDEVARPIKMEYGSEFRNIQVWTRGEYICVEPWMAMAHALNDRKELPLLAAGETRNTFFTIGLGPNTI